MSALLRNLRSKNHDRHYSIHIYCGAVKALARHPHMGFMTFVLIQFKHKHVGYIVTLRHLLNILRSGNGFNIGEACSNVFLIDRFKSVMHNILNDHQSPKDHASRSMVVREGAP